MDRNAFTGEIPNTIGNLFSLRRWYLERNPGLTGTFPAAVADLPQLDELVLYYTRITELTTDICVNGNVNHRQPNVLIFDWGFVDNRK